MDRCIVALLAGFAALVVRGTPAEAEPPAGEVQSIGLDEAPNFQVDTIASGGWYSLSYPPSVPSTSGNSESLSMNVIAFQAPLRDDDSPYSLQPFFQRESTFTMSLSSGRFDTANQTGGVDRTEWNAGVGASFDAYLKRWFAVFAGASYGYFSLHDVDLAETGHSFSTDAGVGFRFRNTRVDLLVGEGISRTSGVFGAWRGNLTLYAFTVIRRRLSLTARGSLVQGGEEGFLEAELFPTKSSGVFASAFVGRYEPYVDPVVVTRTIGSVGFAGWFDATTGVLAEYSLTSETDPATPYVTIGYRELAHTLLLEAYFRLP
jgi:hypothetical protein